MSSNKQQLKMTAVKAWQSISVKETQHSVMSMRLQSPASQDFHPSIQTILKLRYMLVCQIIVGPNPVKTKITFLPCRNNPNRFCKSHQCHFLVLFFSSVYNAPKSQHTHMKKMKTWINAGVYSLIYLYLINQSLSIENGWKQIKNETSIHIFSSKGAFCTV